MKNPKFQFATAVDENTMVELFDNNQKNKYDITPFRNCQKRRDRAAAQRRELPAETMVGKINRGTG